MEMFSADDDEQWQIIQEMLNSSDYYIVIIGHKYGSMTTEGISFTEKEYDYAKEKGIPIMAFVRDRNVPIANEHRENDPAVVSKLDKFIEKATASKMCDFWQSIDDLATKVAIALPKVIARKPQKGWIRGDEGISKEISEEIVELSNENRTLREKIRDLESQIVVSKPKIGVNYDINLANDIFLSSELANWKFNEFKTLTVEDIPEHLVNYVSEHELIAYNNMLPEPSITEKYVEELKFYLSAKEAFKPKIDISNAGDVKANDINIKMIFPDFVRLIKVCELEDLEAPESPLPNDPIANAEKKHKKDQLSKNNPLMAQTMAISDMYSPNFQNLINTNRLVSSQFINHSLNVIGNNVSCKLKSLMHTCNHLFENELAIVPVGIGSGHISVSIICEEFKAPKMINIPITVHVSTNN
tara:strand:- start:4478 stop:5719 length:1242 start_codon:yes stop_codon:yes gene_type:complete